MCLTPAFFLLLLHTAAVAAPSPSVSTAAACKSSLYPKLCRAVLAPLRLPSKPYEYGRFSVKQALKRARRTSKLLDHYLAGGGDWGRGVGGGALEDCRQLNGLNLEYLETVEAELGPGESVLNPAGADRVRALMSAVVTNQQTCFDGLEASRIFPELRGAFSDETRVYGVSLELVSAALDRTVVNRSESDSLPVQNDASSPPFGLPAMGRNLVHWENGEVVPINQSVTVATDGSGNFSAIADAVAFAPNDTSIEDGYFAIRIGEGVFEENVVVGKRKKNLILIGAGNNRTVVTGNRSVADGWTTFKSATFAVHGDRFIAINITFENTAGPEKHQAVAVRNSADLSSFYRCSFLGYQDTLYAHSLRQFYRDCDVYGTVDFIFGNAASVFQNCNIYARKPLPDQANAITAQGRTCPNQTTGISIHNCTIRAAPDLEADLNSTKTFLGRPWKEYSRTVYMQSSIDRAIDPLGWMEWNGTFALSTLYYGEFENYGPGANTSGRVQWPGYHLMNASEALNFTVYNFTMGDAWLSATAIPYSGGLL
ncbi:probable pectinesterase/pectinesterase inhibitor 25 [Phoenix dactylifera]|uniref:Pectinesterase n=1 Tax=Phoenix dactylifera TaxID=42345 RepID=A0A8B8ZRJ5_PHODC|nr:probable pectinesterase/pectinesterase inhibitor 25 [Phoenix dactylifera]